MNIYVVSISTAIAANIAYHLSLKYTNPLAHPLASLSISYGVAFLSCLCLLPFFSKGPVSQQFHHLNWSAFVLGLSICGLELGFLLAYRAGWNISQAALFCNVAVGLILLPIGLALFREKLSSTNLVGIALALAGLILLGKR